MAGPLPIIRLTVPLFSSDYAKVNREIAEWNRRARAASLSLDDQIADLQLQIDGLSSTTGNSNSIIANLQAQIDALEARVDDLEANRVPVRGVDNPNTLGLIGAFDQQVFINTETQERFFWNAPTAQWWP